MNRGKFIASCAVVLSAAAVPAGATLAAGGNGASFCSNSGAPVGGAPATFGNAGEIISWIAQNVGHGKDNHPGPVVAAECNPTAP